MVIGTSPSRSSGYPTWIVTAMIPKKHRLCWRSTGRCKISTWHTAIPCSGDCGRSPHDRSCAARPYSGPEPSVGGSEIRIIDAAVHRAQFRTKGTPDSMIYWCRFESEVARTPRKRRREIIRTSRRQQDRCSGHHRPAAPVRIVAVAKYKRSAGAILSHVSFRIVVAC